MINHIKTDRLYMINHIQFYFNLIMIICHMINHMYIYILMINLIMINLYD